MKQCLVLDLYNVLDSLVNLKHFIMFSFLILDLFFLLFEEDDLLVNRSND